MAKKQKNKRRDLNGVVFFDTPNAAIAANFKVLSSSLARAIIKACHPSIESMITTPPGTGKGVAYPEGVNADNMRWQSLCPKVNPMDRPVTLVLLRDPVAKFLSACVEDRILTSEAIDDKLDKIEADIASGAKLSRRLKGLSQHFYPQGRLCKGKKVKAYLLERDRDVFVADAGLAWPLPHITGGDNRPDKPTLTAEQEQRVREHYADDITLYDSIAEAGQEVAPLPDPEPTPVPKYVPASVTKRQFKLALLRSMSITGDDIVARINQMTDDADRAEALINWEDATFIERANPLVGRLGASMGKTSDEIDDLFIYAEGIK